jgi:hypothetical protein
VEPVYIGQFGVVNVSGVEARWNGDGNKHQQKREAGLDEFGGLLRFGEEPEEAEVGEEGEGEEGFFGHGEEGRKKREEGRKKLGLGLGVAIDPPGGGHQGDVADEGGGGLPGDDPVEGGIVVEEVPGAGTHGADE